MDGEVILDGELLEDDLLKDDLLNIESDSIVLDE